MLIKKPFYFLRHGQTDWNTERRWQGQTDIPLNEHGKNQARSVQEYITHSHIGAVFYSPLSRAHETMMLATEHLAHIPRIPLDDLKEWHYGDLEGKIADPSWPQSWYDAPPQGETRQEFYERVIRGVHMALVHNDEPVLIVGHYETFSVICHYAGVEHMPIGNAGLAHIVPVREEAWDVRIISSSAVHAQKKRA